MPRNLDEVLERAKDIQYSSKTRFNTSRAKEEEALRDALTHVHREAAAAPAQGSAGRAAGRARARAPDLDRPPDQPPRRVLVAVEGLRVLARHGARAVGRRPGRHAQDAARPALAQRVQRRHAACGRYDLLPRTVDPAAHPMKIDDVRKRAFAMPLTSPAFPPGPYRFVNREFFIVTYRTDPDALRAVDARAARDHRADRQVRVHPHARLDRLRRLHRERAR